MVSLKRKVRRNFKVVGTEANIALKSQKLNSNNSILDKTQFSKRIETFVNPNPVIVERVKEVEKEKEEIQSNNINLYIGIGAGLLLILILAIFLLRGKK